MKLTVAELFARLDSLPEDVNFICLPARGLGLRSLLFVYDADALPDDQDHPPDAAALGDVVDVELEDVRDIVRNARAQGVSLTPEQFCEALAYYAINDAFLEWGPPVEYAPPGPPVERAPAATHGLLVAVDGNINDVMAQRLYALVQEYLPQVAWRTRAPLWVNETDDSSCSRPEDQPIRTVGVFLELTPAPSPELTVEADEGEVADARAVIALGAHLSGEKGLPFVVELGGEPVGRIARGVPDEWVTEGLLGEWERGLRRVGP